MVIRPAVKVISSLLILSRMIGRAVQDKNGEKIATLKDIIVRINPEEGKSEEKYPPLAGLVARQSGRDFFISYSLVRTFDESGIRLFSARVSLERFKRRNGEILLVRDVFDRQLVDVEGRRVIRVNDLALSRATEHEVYRLVAVDISFQALLRRLGPRLGSHPLRLISRHENLLDWSDVEYFASAAPTVRLNVSHDRLAKLHPVDIARLLEDLSYVQGQEIVNALDDETAAETLEEMEPEDAADLIEGLEEGRAADILEEMEPDDAADLLAEIEDPAKAEELLNLMESEEQQDVRELLSYHEDTAGGLMTTDFVMLPETFTAAEGLQFLRAMEDKPDLLYYLYIVQPGSDRLTGVMSLRDLVLAEPTDLISNLMEPEVVYVRTGTSAENAASLIAEYNLVALPVLDEAGDLHGIITADDAMELVLPDDVWKRVPRLFRGFTGGSRPRAG